MDDLYGDLDTSTKALEKKEALDLKTKVEKENKRLRDELAQLQEQNRQLGAANKQLESNISTLFATAQLELGRKDKEIKRLRTACMCSSSVRSARSLPSNAYRINCWLFVRTNSSPHHAATTSTRGNSLDMYVDM
ncbi:uncharacterized protein PITG_04702 [Phytophthora infestans T30-4]|uniref:Uncharacterized protein n=1 Tax=Phytophthora infestans (strain T30-4) TaxID=403677 RepID=D0N1U8_PHYIT|nr:uncharacterized protein PITG_04702 [Phytophthora infestans T30-4]EEY68277.1 conserved hypothetical protein [Phytophthora infestans T30-4]|eukprot:XP_002905436.1 conserved hypothetical protein [Phytophthora infestans T30-4]